MIVLLTSGQFSNGIVSPQPAPQGSELESSWMLLPALPSVRRQDLEPNERWD